MNNFMSFDDIFDLDDDTRFSRDVAEHSVTNEEKNSGLWDTGTKENIWRTNDSGSDPNAVWDAGAYPSCPSECEECEEVIEETEETNPVPGPEEAETFDPAADSSGGMFDDIF